VNTSNANVNVNTYNIPEGDDKSLQAVKLLQQTEERKALLSQAEELLRRANMSLSGSSFKPKVSASILRHSMQAREEVPIVTIR